MVSWETAIKLSIFMARVNPFKWRHYQPEIILRWYCLYPISYRNLEGDDV